MVAQRERWLEPHACEEVMSRAQVLPTILILIDIGAALVWAVDGDFRRAIYWVGAAVLTATVTF